MPKAVGYRLVIEVDRAEQKIGSIFIPEESRLLNEEYAQSGKVLEIGPLAFKPNEPWVNIGDRIFFKTRGQLFRYKDGSKIRIINDEDVICIADPEKDIPGNLL